MQISVDPRLEKILDNFSQADRARISRLIELFEERGFALSNIYLKKLNKFLWELRPGKVRLLFGIIEQRAIVVNIFVKKTGKIPTKEIKLAQRRLAQYQ